MNLLTALKEGQARARIKLTSVEGGVLIATDKDGELKLYVVRNSDAYEVADVDSAMLCSNKWEPYPPEVREGNCVMVDRELINAATSVCDMFLSPMRNHGDLERAVARLHHYSSLHKGKKDT